jgi:membrane AbrB-like protein
MHLLNAAQRSRLLHAVAGLAVSTVGGALCAWIASPLPWMIGPLLSMALFNFGGAQLKAMPLGREVGQFLIAVTLGLYFTPVVAGEVVAHGALLVAAAVGAVALGYAASRILIGVARVDPVTAFFASIPGGATEMANLGDRFGAAVDKVAVSHSLRILLVVCTIPVMMTLSGVHGGDVYRPVVIPFDAGKLAWLFVVASAGGLLFSRIHFPNPWMMGPLIATIALTASGIELSSIPRPLTNAGQVLLGCALGTRFSRAFLHRAPRFLAAVVISIYAMMGMSAAMAWALAKGANVFVPSMILACAPGGIAEMSITARTLQLGVALVTAAHVTRVLIIVSFAQPVYHQLQKRWSRSR